MIVSDLLLGWMHEDGYSLSESGWMNPRSGQQWMQLEATKDAHRRGLQLVVAGAMWVVFAGCDRAIVTQQKQHADMAPVAFEDASAALDFERVSLPFGGTGLGGAAWFDFNNDGLLDLFLTNGISRANALIANNADGTFRDVAGEAGVESLMGSSGVIAADIDNDGYEDLFLTGDGAILGSRRSPVTLYHNNQDGTFSDITAESGIIGPETTLGAAFADIDNDGYLDLFITAPGSLRDRERHACKLYRNNGDLTFTDISVSAGVDSMRGACVAFFSDYNSDGLIDLFVGNSNDVNYLPMPIQLFRNDGDLHFTDVSAQAGLGPGGYWMGFGPADFDNDGDIDIFVTNLGNAYTIPYWHALYQNNCDGTFTDVAGPAGAAEFEFGWGTVFTDLDNDGHADIFFAGSAVGLGGVIGPGRGNPGTLLINNRDDTFADFTDTLPLDLSSHYTSGVAHGDYDNDGFPDIVIVVEKFRQNAGLPVLYHNLGNDNHWLTVRLEGTVSNRSAVGARVQIISGELTLAKEIYAGSGAFSMDSKWLTFGLGGNEMVDEIRVRWPRGLVERFAGVPADQAVTLTEGSGTTINSTVDATCQ